MPAITKERSGFTLVELLVVVIIIALLSTLTLGGLRAGSVSAKRDLTRALVLKLSEGVLELYEELSDLGFDTDASQPATLITKQLPLSTADLDPVGTGHSPYGNLYANYWHGFTPSATHPDAEFLYMIVTETGSFSEILETLRGSDIRDTDNPPNGKSEFVDAWGNPIRWQFTPTLNASQTSISELPRIYSVGLDGDATTTRDNIASILELGTGTGNWIFLE
jgi:prepilin-type N-terminal cleavage/methylation domain-containing protein